MTIFLINLFELRLQILEIICFEQQQKHSNLNYILCVTNKCPLDNFFVKKKLFFLIFPKKEFYSMNLNNKK